MKDHTAGILVGLAFLFVLWLAESGKLIGIKSIMSQPAVSSLPASSSTGDLQPANPNALPGTSIVPSKTNGSFNGALPAIPPAVGAAIDATLPGYK
jgi:hypothetical protein